ncbi:hypothetical protein G6O69_37655 [Pseudenhygromyxa sp. WMMC2535]|uniref:hypothetical protein n=1 Tax=Pseudenhygromyxa sp. WMMC2535 TaxID=2712867 RepID=UPI0015959F3C|nr:hypothetical protein [Pseudenhygromyxa sp. WMMC2535]NVB43597.1 hypothetical protein [Pseudenhygromyxa sp. WMMC2535]
MSRLLLIEGDALRLGLDEQLVERVELEGDAQAPSLFAGLGLSEESERVGQAGRPGTPSGASSACWSCARAPECASREHALIVEDVEVMALPELLRPFAPRPAWSASSSSRARPRWSVIHGSPTRKTATRERRCPGSSARNSGRASRRGPARLHRRAGVRPRRLCGREPGRDLADPLWTNDLSRALLLCALLFGLRLFAWLAQLGLALAPLRAWRGACSELDDETLRAAESALAGLPRKMALNLTAGWVGYYVALTALVWWAFPGLIGLEAAELPAAGLQIAAVAFGRRCCSPR